MNVFSKELLHPGGMNCWNCQNENLNNWALIDAGRPGCAVMADTDGHGDEVDAPP
jgi:hypothetical protein